MKNLEMLKCKNCPLREQTADYNENWVEWNCLWDNHPLGSYKIPGQLDTPENSKRQQDKLKCYDQDCSLSVEEVEKLIKLFQDEFDSR